MYYMTNMPTFDEEQIPLAHPVGHIPKAEHVPSHPDHMHVWVHPSGHFSGHPSGHSSGHPSGHPSHLSHQHHWRHMHQVDEQSSRQSQQSHAFCDVFFFSFFEQNRQDADKLGKCSAVWGQRICCFIIVILILAIFGVIIDAISKA